VNVKEKLTKFKDQVKENAPQIVCVAITITSAAYAVILKQQLAEEKRRFPEGSATRLGVNDCCFEELKSGEAVIWNVNGHSIDIAYDPTC
jgi:hypothetical protein